MDEKDFYEEQRLNNIWLWLAIAILVLSPVLIAIFAQELTLVSSIIALPVLILLLMFKLKTHVHQEGITIQMFPIIIHPKKILWEEIEKAYVRSYKPIPEYGGWGVRVSFNHGTAYTIKGKDGLQLELKNGKKILIGTQNPEKIQKAVMTYFDAETVN